MAYGINQWGASGTYEGADLMRELNGDYLNSSLSANANWYNNSNNSLGNGNFNKNYVLKASAQELIGEAIWYTGAVPNNGAVTLADAYAAERGISTINNPTDGVERTTSWVGKVGLIYPSDFGYASENVNCTTNIGVNGNCSLNWMQLENENQWTITPSPNLQGDVLFIYQSYIWSSWIYNHGAATSVINVKPSVYLISGVNIRGSGTTTDPFIFFK